MGDVLGIALARCEMSDARLMDENNAQVYVTSNFGELWQLSARQSLLLTVSSVQQDKSSNLEWLKETNSEKSDQSASSFGL